MSIIGAALNMRLFQNFFVKRGWASYLLVAPLWNLQMLWISNHKGIPWNLAHLTKSPSSVTLQHYCESGFLKIHFCMLNVRSSYILKTELTYVELQPITFSSINNTTTMSLNTINSNKCLQNIAGTSSRSTRRSPLIL